MLTITSTQMKALEASSQEALASRLDSWLPSVMPGWLNVPAATRVTQLMQIAEIGRSSGMASENEMAVFVFVCVSIGPDWREKITAKDVLAWLSDPQWPAQSKLLRLEEQCLGGRMQ